MSSVPDAWSLELPALARRCLASPPRAGQTRVVAVDGPSGSGKTTLATALARDLAAALGACAVPPAPAGRMPEVEPGPGSRVGAGCGSGVEPVRMPEVEPVRIGVPLIAMDDIYPGWDGLEEAVPRLVSWVLEPLSRRAAAGYRRYDWVGGRDGEWQHLPDSPTAIVVEGVGCGATPCRPYLSLLVWVEAADDLRFARAMERDGAAYEPHWQRWAAQERRHFAVNATRSWADVVLSGPGPQ